jgi:AraC family transcriptional regulator of arabinose operon
MDRRVETVIALMHGRLDAPLTIAILAREVNLSPSRLIHLFTRETGVSPARYLRDLRLARAGAELESSFLSVKQIMARVGFNDPSHFSRAFRRYHGVSPRALRSRARAGRGRAGGRVRDPDRQQKPSTVSRIGPHPLYTPWAAGSLQ